MVKLVEQCSGTGQLLRDNDVVREVRYELSVFQGMAAGSGLPIPGQRTLTGCVDFDPRREAADLIGPVLTLRLEDGRYLGIPASCSRFRPCATDHGIIRRARPYCARRSLRRRMSAVDGFWQG